MQMRFVFAAAALLLPMTAYAQTQSDARADPLDPAFACMTITDEHERVTCYDTALGHLKAARTSGDVVAIDRGQAQQLDREAFGFQLPSLPHLFARGAQQTTANEVPLEIASISRRGDGKTLFRMTNGQVWVLIDSNSSPLARAGGAVTIRRASLGSYLMVVQAGGRPLRVQRQE